MSASQGTAAGQRGSAAAELVLITPVLVALLGLVGLGGRAVTALGGVDAAARDAARAASIARDPAAAHAQGVSAARASLAAQAACEQPEVAVDVAGFRPGGRVSAVVTCRLRLAGLSLLPVPGRLTLTGQAVSVVDRHRGAS